MNEKLQDSYGFPKIVIGTIYKECPMKMNEVSKFMKMCRQIRRKYTNLWGGDQNDENFEAIFMDSPMALL